MAPAPDARLMLPKAGLWKEGKKMTDRPRMTRAELAEHRVGSHSRNYRLSCDGYGDMEVAERQLWHTVALWGRDGWNLGDWPYVSFYVRETNDGGLSEDGKMRRLYEMQVIVEGDHDVYRFDSEADREAAIDYLFLWYAAGKRWAPLKETDRDQLDAGTLVVEDKWRGPYQEHSPERDAEELRAEE